MQQIVAMYIPEKTKRTQMMTGTAADVAHQLVTKLRDEARVVQ